MNTIVRKTSDEPIDAEMIEELKRLAAMPDSDIRTDIIPERHFNLPLAAERRKSGWKPGVVVRKKAS